MNTKTARSNRACGLLSSVGVASLALVLTGCGAVEAKCEQLINQTVEVVDGVKSVDAACSESFGSSNASAGWVHLDADSEAEADEIIARIEEAMARNPEIDSDWYGPARVSLNEGSSYIASSSKTGVVRERLGIDP